MTAARCQQCGAENPDGFLCHLCAEKLEDIIGELPNLIHHLQISLTRQDRTDVITSRVYGTVGEADARSPLALIATPWPYSIDAGRMLEEVRALLVGTVRHLCEHRGLSWPRITNRATVPGPVCVPQCKHSSCEARRPREQLATFPALTAWLSKHGEQIIQDPAAGRVLREFDRLHQRAARLVFGHDADVFLGRCDAQDVRSDYVGGTITPKPGVCGADLYAHEEDKQVGCQACGFVYDVTERRASMLAAAEDHLDTIPRVASAIQGYLRNSEGEPVQCTQGMIHGFLRRGQILEKGSDGRAAFVRVGDVVRLLLDREERKLSRRPRRISA